MIETLVKQDWTEVWDLEVKLGSLLIFLLSTVASQSVTIAQETITPFFFWLLFLIFFNFFFYILCCWFLPGLQSRLYIVSWNKRLLKKGKRGSKSEVHCLVTKRTKVHSVRSEDICSSPVSLLPANNSICVFEQFIQWERIIKTGATQLISYISFLHYRLYASLPQS